MKVIYSNVILIFIILFFVNSIEAQPGDSSKKMYILECDSNFACFVNGDLNKNPFSTTFYPPMFSSYAKVQLMHRVDTTYKIDIIFDVSELYESKAYVIKSAPKEAGYYMCKLRNNCDTSYRLGNSQFYGQDYCEISYENWDNYRVTKEKYAKQSQEIGLNSPKNSNKVFEYSWGNLFIPCNEMYVYYQKQRYPYETDYYESTCKCSSENKTINFEGNNTVNYTLKNEGLGSDYYLVKYKRDDDSIVNIVIKNSDNSYHYSIKTLPTTGKYFLLDFDSFIKAFNPINNYDIVGTNMYAVKTTPTNWQDHKISEREYMKLIKAKSKKCFNKRN